MLREIPNQLNGVKIEYNGPTKLHTYTEIHTLIFSHNNKKVEENIRLPKQANNDSTIFLNGKTYYPIPCLAKPILLVNKDSRVITIKNVLTDFISTANYDFSVYLSKAGSILYDFWGQRYFSAPSTRDLQRAVLRDNDRSALNKALNIDIEEPHLTLQDLVALEKMLIDDWDDVEETDWRVIDDLRICNLSDMISMVVTLNLPKLINGFLQTGEINQKIMTSACKSYMSEGSQCQLMEESTSLAHMALGHKLSLPIHQYDGYEAADPHPSWFGTIDSITTPQSEKCGQVVSLCDGVTIKKGRFEKC